MREPHHAVLACHQCQRETVHEVHYAGRLLLGITCTTCRRAVGAADLNRYLLDLGHRAATKPGRMLRRLRRDPAEFVRTLPRAAASKPLRLMHEVAELLRANDAGELPRDDDMTSNAAKPQVRDGLRS